MTVGYSLRLSVRLFSKMTARESYSLESDAAGPLSSRIKVLVVPSIVGGFFLSGFMPFNDRVILPLWLKIIILRGVMVLFFTALTGIVNLSPSSLILSGVHQI